MSLGRLLVCFTDKDSVLSTLVFFWGPLLNHFGPNPNLKVSAS